MINVLLSTDLKHNFTVKHQDKPLLMKINKTHNYTEDRGTFIENASNKLLSVAGQNNRHNAFLALKISSVPISRWLSLKSIVRVLCNVPVFVMCNLY